MRFISKNVTLSPLKIGRFSTQKSHDVTSLKTPCSQKLLDDFAETLCEDVKLMLKKLDNLRVDTCHHFEVIEKVCRRGGVIRSYPPASDGITPTPTSVHSRLIRSKMWPIFKI